MDSIRIKGGRQLKGSITICGAKNAALPLMATSLLTEDTVTLSNLPHLLDITTMANLLSQHGVAISMNGDSVADGHMGRVLELTCSKEVNTLAPYELVRRMRASVLVLGPLLAKHGKAKVSLPGGCAIGTRPVDLHLAALQQMGAEIEIHEGYIHALAPKGLKGAHIIFPKVSVGATENILMAATLAEGETVIANAAREPEVSDLAHCLVSMGAEIEGIDSGTLRVKGKPSLHGTNYSVVPDRIETATYAVAAVITRGDIELIGGRLDLLEAVAKALTDCGAKITPTEKGFRVDASSVEIAGIDIMTEPYPGFPTDMQAQFMALLATAKGASMVTETIFENRFMHVPELSRMGARVNVHGASAIVRGVGKLSGAPVMATDLRASVSLVLAGLAAEGETFVNRVYHLDRGYERLEEKLAACGAEIERIKGG
jgi:UDP-N-acetylglucosamine 1-carboxyvinyltransferase